MRPDLRHHGAEPAAEDGLCLRLSEYGQGMSFGHQTASLFLLSSVPLPERFSAPCDVIQRHYEYPE